MSDDTVQMEIRPNIWNRIVRFMFPNQAWEWSEKRGAFFGEHPYGVHTETFVLLDWKDRIRVLVSGELVIKASTKTNADPGSAETISTAVVLPRGTIAARKS